MIKWLQNLFQAMQRPYYYHEHRKVCLTDRNGKVIESREETVTVERRYGSSADDRSILHVVEGKKHG